MRARSTTDPPQIIIDPAPDAAQRLRRLSQILLGNAVSPVRAEDTAAPSPPLMEKKQMQANLTPGAVPGQPDPAVTDQALKQAAAEQGNHPGAEPTEVSGACRGG